MDARGMQQRPPLWGPNPPVGNQGSEELTPPLNALPRPKGAANVPWPPPAGMGPPNQNAGAGLLPRPVFELGPPGPAFPGPGILGMNGPGGPEYEPPGSGLPGLFPPGLAMRPGLGPGPEGPPFPPMLPGGLRADQCLLEPLFPGQGHPRPGLLGPGGPALGFPGPGPLGREHPLGLGGLPGPGLPFLGLLGPGQGFPRPGPRDKGFGFPGPGPILPRPGMFPGGPPGDGPNLPMAEVAAMYAGRMAGLTPEQVAQVGLFFKAAQMNRIEHEREKDTERGRWRDQEMAQKMRKRSPSPTSERKKAKAEAGEKAPQAQSPSGSLTQTADQKEEQPGAPEKDEASAESQEAKEDVAEGHTDGTVSENAVVGGGETHSESKVKDAEAEKSESLKPEEEHDTGEGEKQTEARAQEEDKDGGKKEEKGDIDESEKSEEPPPPSATICLKGLPPGTHEDTLYSVLGMWGPLKHVRVIKDRHTGANRGFAFVDFPSPEAAKRMKDALRLRGGLILANRFVSVEYGKSQHGQDAALSGSSGGDPTAVLPSDWRCSNCGINNFARRTECFKCNVPKLVEAGWPMGASQPGPGVTPSSVLMVRGVDDTTLGESLHCEFSKYGPIKVLRIVKDKVTQLSRGFAFVHFHSVEDATKALAATNGIRLDRNGQTLRVAYAKEGPGGSAGSAGPVGSLPVPAASHITQQYEEVGWLPKEYTGDASEAPVPEETNAEGILGKAEDGHEGGQSAEAATAEEGTDVAAEEENGEPSEKKVAATSAENGVSATEEVKGPSEGAEGEDSEKKATKSEEQVLSKTEDGQGSAEPVGKDTTEQSKKQTVHLSQQVTTPKSKADYYMAAHTLVAAKKPVSGAPSLAPLPGAGIDRAPKGPSRGPSGAGLPVGRGVPWGGRPPPWPRQGGDGWPWPEAQMMQAVTAPPSPWERQGRGGMAAVEARTMEAVAGPRPPWGGPLGGGLSLAQAERMEAATGPRHAWGSQGQGGTSGLEDHRRQGATGPPPPWERQGRAGMPHPGVEARMMEAAAAVEQYEEEVRREQEEAALNAGHPGGGLLPVASTGGMQMGEAEAAGGGGAAPGFVWDEASGYYLDASTGMYYDGYRGLYYDGNSGQWYTLDPQSNQYTPCGNPDEAGPQESESELGPGPAQYAYSQQQNAEPYYATPGDGQAYPATWHDGNGAYPYAQSTDAPAAGIQPQGGVYENAARGAAQPGRGFLEQASGFMVGGHATGMLGYRPPPLGPGEGVGLGPAAPGPGGPPKKLSLADAVAAAAAAAGKSEREKERERERERELNRRKVQEQLNMWKQRQHEAAQGGRPGPPGTPGGLPPGAQYVNLAPRPQAPPGATAGRPWNDAVPLPGWQPGRSMGAGFGEGQGPRPAVGGMEGPFAGLPRMPAGGGGGGGRGGGLLPFGGMAGRPNEQPTPGTSGILGAPPGSGPGRGGGFGPEAAGGGPVGQGAPEGGPQPFKTDASALGSYNQTVASKRRFAETRADQPPQQGFEAGMMEGQPRGGGGPGDMPFPPGVLGRGRGAMPFPPGFQGRVPGFGRGGPPPREAPASLGAPFGGGRGPAGEPFEMNPAKQGLGGPMGGSHMLRNMGW